MSRIERIDISHHQLALDPPFPAAWDPQPRRLFPQTVVRVTDDSGRTGFGAGDAVRGLTDYLHLFIGTDATDLERHAAVLDNISFLDGRPWILDTALWDLAGHVEGGPLWELLGGSDPVVGLYASTGSLRGTGETVELARTVAAAGFAAMKLRMGRPRIEDDFDVISAVASETRLDILVDCNQGWRMPWDTAEPWGFEKAAKVADRLADLGAAWMEEPLHRGDHAGYARLRERSALPIAGGEMTRELHELNLMVEAGALDIYQPDAAVTGGVLGLTRLAATVHASGARFTPHTWGSGAALLVNAHLFAAVEGGPYLEYPYDPPFWTPERRDFLFVEPIVAEGGELDLGSSPGLGARLDPDALARTQTDSISYS